MKIIATRVLRGPNIHSPRPCFLAEIDLEDLEDLPSTAVPGFNDRLYALFPGLIEHRCSEGHRGGFLERLRDGTYMAHITEHVLLELMCLTGPVVGFGKTRSVPRKPGHYTIAVSYKLERLVEAALPVAMRVVETLCRGEPVEISDDLRRLEDIVERYGVGPSTRAVVEAAQNRDIPVFRVTEESSLFQLGWGRHQKRLQATITGNTRFIAVDIASDKELTKALLREDGLPVPQGGVAYSVAEAVALAGRLGGPVALKPFNGNQGKGVSLNLCEAQQVQDAYELAASYHPAVVVEQYIDGNDYRVLVVGDEVVAAACLSPAHVTGDGRHTIAELVAAENRNPARGAGHMKPMTHIRIDGGTRQVLARQGHTETSVPSTGQKVILKGNANLSTGGSAEDVTHLIHPENAALCIRAAQKIGLDVAGIDLVCPDIAVAIKESGGAIIEVNAAPGIRMHQYPSRGQCHDVGAAIVDMLYPPGTTARIPVFAVTGTNGKTTTTLMIGHCIQNTGQVTGVTTTEGIYINGRLIDQGDCTGYWSARTVLTNPRVEVAVLETARGGILKRGLAFDVSSVGIVLNVHDDHLGQDGIETLEDLARVKSLVAETTRVAVLNADDPHCVDMAHYVRPGAEVIYFSMQPQHPVVQRHLAEGGRAVYLCDNMIMTAAGGHSLPLEDVEAIPATLRGRARFNVANTLAAVAALWAGGYSSAQIVAGLTTFTSSVEQNPMRMNFFRVRDFDVLVDYAHNLRAYQALIETGRNLHPHRLIGVITAPGDRQAEKLQDIGRLCAQGFDELFIFEMADRRGRAPGEVAQLILNGVRDATADMLHIHVIPDEVEAVRMALDMAHAGDLVIVGCAEEHGLQEVERQAEGLVAGATTATPSYTLRTL